MRATTRNLVAGAGAVAVVAAGVAGTLALRGDDAPAAPIPTAPATSAGSHPSRAPARGGYASVTDMWARLDDAGAPCRDEETIPVAEPTLAEFGRCTLARAPEHEIGFYLLADLSRLHEWLDALKGSYGRPVVVGRNWFVTAGTKANARSIRAALGGRIVGGGGTPAPTGEHEHPPPPSP